MDPQKLGFLDNVKKIISSTFTTPPPYDQYAESKQASSLAPPVPPAPNTIQIPNSDMKISINTAIREKYRGASLTSWEKHTRDLSDVKQITLHATGGGSFEGIMTWMVGEDGQEAERSSEYKKSIALYHYLISKERGKIAEIISPDYWVWHGSCSSYDQYTIGIECVKGDPNNNSILTEAQYDNLFTLIFNYLLPILPNCNRICSHNYSAIKYKGVDNWPCPGNFDWQRLSAELTKRGFQYKEWSFPQDAAKGIIDLKYEIKKLA